MPVLEAIPWLAHAFSVRGSRPEAILRNEMRVAHPPRTLRQIHGARVVRIDDGDDGPGGAGDGPPQGDVLVTDRPGVSLGVWVADCVPVLIADPASRAVAAVHAGWRGTVAGALAAAIASLRHIFGARPHDLRVAIGPSIGPCCFEVGDEVVAALLGADPGATDCVSPGPVRPHVDLWEANRRQAIAAGATGALIETARLCTCCHGDLLESYRREGAGAGRMAAVIARRDESGL